MIVAAPGAMAAEAVPALPVALAAVPSAAAAPAVTTARAGISWQLILADLSLILFMVTAGAWSQEVRRAHAAPARSAADAPASARAPVQAPVLALYRPGPGAPPLARWLAAQPADPRQQLTIVAQYAPGGQLAAIARAQSQVAALGPAGAGARIVIEPGGSALAASLAYDAGPPLARGLQSMRGAATSAQP